jgi:hypothetical protein
MWFKYILILFLLSFATSNLTFAQEDIAKKDSTHIYENIESYSKRSRFNKFIYSLVFKSVAPSPSKKKVKKKVYKKLIKNPYSTFEGKTIRHINIVTLDPFGYSISETHVTALNIFSNSGNALHLKSNQINIQNLLLIRENQVFDSLFVNESERLIRSQSYVRDVSFKVKATSQNSDSVDIFIRELDNWSIIPDGAYSISRTMIQLIDKNFLGLGHEFSTGYTWYPNSRDYAYATNYFIPNIRNTFINANLHYDTDKFENSIKRFAVDRPFFSPLAKWAAGVDISQQIHYYYAYTSIGLPFELQPFKFNKQDFWLGNAMQIFKGSSGKERTSNFISTARFLRIRYLEKPIEIIDPHYMFSSEDLYLASIGISTRNYVRDKYIFDFGVTEDVPIGRVYSVTGGFQKKNNADRLYVGARISFGNYYSWGYLSSNFEYGTFMHASNVEQGVFTAEINYFTGLLEIGNWRFRNFVKPEVTFGFNRFDSDSLTINDGYGLDGFNSSTLSGTNRLLLTFQTQSYAPWNFIGFRFGIFLSYSIGMLSNSISEFSNSKAYSQIGVGVLIKNENFIFNTFQFSFSYYPSIPGTGEDVFKANSFKTRDFGFRDFEIGKPYVAVYQ